MCVDMDIFELAGCMSATEDEDDDTPLGKPIPLYGWMGNTTEGKTLS